jgi:hypothetical protein
MIVDNPSAIAITYFSERCRPNEVVEAACTSALIFGYNKPRVDKFRDLLRSWGAFELTDGPFKIMAAFLEVEKDRRFNQVRSERIMLERLGRAIGNRLVRDETEELPRRTINDIAKELHLSQEKLLNLRDVGLEAWCAGLLQLQQDLGPENLDGHDVMSKYLKELISHYEVRIRSTEALLRELEGYRQVCMVSLNWLVTWTFYSRMQEFGLLPLSLLLFVYLFPSLPFRAASMCEQLRRLGQIFAPYCTSCMMVTNYQFCGSICKSARELSWLLGSWLWVAALPSLFSFCGLSLRNSWHTTLGIVYIEKRFHKKPQLHQLSAKIVFLTLANTKKK